MTSRVRSSAAAASALVLMVALAACGPVPPPPPGALPPTDVPYIKPSINIDGVDTSDGFTAQEHTAVRLRVSTCTGWTNGSGFILDDSHIITNMHVVEDAIAIEITTYDGRDYKALDSQIAPVADLAMVRLEPVFTEWVTLADTKLEPNDPVMSAGYPDAQALVVEDGYYIAPGPDELGATGEFVYEFRLDSKHGSSGSAIFNAEGEVTAILHGGDESGWSLGWPVSWLQELIDDPSLWQPNTSNC
jgi:S1-C subfamily serine protease